MKKSLSLLFGISLLSAIIIPFSLASRDAYHSYLMSSQNNLRNQRYFTNRFGNFKWFTQKNAVELKSRSKGALIPNLRYPLGNKRYLYSRTPILERTSVIRHSTQRITSIWQSPLQRRRLVIRNLAKKKEVFQTHENDAFSVRLPKGWNALEGKSHFFVSADPNLTISIKKLENNPCKEIKGFTACAISLSKNENRKAVDGQGKLLTTSRIIRRSTLSDTVLNIPEIMTPVYTESFSAQYIGKEKYVSRYFVKDLDGGVYLIEVVSQVRDARKNIESSKQIFDSFRIYEVK